MARELVVKLVGDDTSLRRAFFRSSTGAKGFERDIGRASRGALAGSGVFRSLGRSIAFASGGFLAFASAGQFLRKSVDAAKEAAVVQSQLQAQFKASGKVLGDYQKQIDHTSNRLSLLAGFQNDEVKSAFLTIFRTTGDVSKALRDTATAADLARAKHIGLAQAALIVAKTEAGNTTLLRRQGFAIDKNAGAVKALAALRQVVAGQARAGTTEQERFGAVLHDTEEIIGTGILPVLNKYLAAGAVWLTQMNESGDLQKNVAKITNDFAGAMSELAGIVKGVDKVTGGFKNTLELLVGLKVASWATGVGRNFGLIGGGARGAAGEARGLRAALLSIGNPAVLAALGAAVAVFKGFDSASKHLRSEPVKGGLLTRDTKTGGFSFRPSTANRGSTRPHQVSRKVGEQLLNDAGLTDSTGAIDPDVLAKVRHGAALVRDRLTGVIADTLAAPSSHVSAGKRNTFFDNAISRILLRGGLGNVQQQIAALRKADTLIAQRLAVTKDITRRLNLEDELLQNQAQIKSLTGQQTADRLQAAEDARQKALDALARRATARNAAQFKALGLTATGETRAPSVRNLRNALGTLSDAVKGTFLDTSKTQSVFSQIRKVLSGNLGAVGRDVRLQIQQIIGDLNQQLKKNATDQTKFRHVNSNAILSGLGLSPDEIRALRARISQVGAGGTVPGGRSLAFSQAGANGTVVLHGDIVMDGEKVGRITHSGRIKRGKKRTIPRAG